MASPVGNGAGPAVAIRDMSIDDVAAVFHLGERLFDAEVPNLYRTWDEWEVLSLFQGAPDLCLVATSSRRVVGFALATTIERRGSAWKYGQLVWLGVARRHRRRGIGERLFRTVRDRMVREGVRLMLVDTEADNDEALAFFARQGFGRPEGHVYLSLNLTGRRRGKAARRARG